MSSIETSITTEWWDETTGCWAAYCEHRTVGQAQEAIEVCREKGDTGRWRIVTTTSVEV